MNVFLGFAIMLTATTTLQFFLGLAVIFLTD